MLFFLKDPFPNFPGWSLQTVLKSLADVSWDGLMCATQHWLCVKVKIILVFFSGFQLMMACLSNHTMVQASLSTAGSLVYCLIFIVLWSNELIKNVFFSKCFPVAVNFAHHFSSYMYFFYLNAASGDRITCEGNCTQINKEMLVPASIWCINWIAIIPGWATF